MCLSVSASGFDALTIPGITVQGDQTLSLGNLQVTRHLQTIGRVTARSTNGAFQPTQTTDSYTVSGARIIQTVGKTATTNENNLLLAVPGVTLSNAGIPSIRGGGAREVGYQYDGVTFTEPFLSNNGSNGLINGVGNVQVVEGAGDATQGGVGSGVINIVPKRGAYPGFGYVDLEAGGPNFTHQAAMEYGFATPNGRFSDYITYNGQRFVPYYGNSTTNVAAYNNYFANSYRRTTSSRTTSCTSSARTTTSRCRSSTRTSRSSMGQRRRASGRPVPEQPQLARVLSLRHPRQCDCGCGFGETSG